ncbi:MAG TPA: NAD(P)/FAD-dependent oxidoreductase [Thermoanaerobaculia bacterium]|nr:NAD(P)/FAD-dependent oxidoreductase [Thermoanaerobaculia bacterium]
MTSPAITGKRRPGGAPGRGGADRGGTADTIVVGAGPAGLATAACLRREGVATTILEAGPAVGTSWRNHYRRLHLHTARVHSGLPHLPLPRGAGRYPGRQRVVEYLDAYARRFALEPLFGTAVERIAPRGDGWRVATSRGPFDAPHVVVATGLNRRPVRPSWPGMADFAGQLLHSADYRDGEPFRDRRVLVVGMGNTGAEIALDLVEHGAAAVAISVRDGVNVIPRDILGLPVQSLGLATRFLPLAMRDKTMRRLSRLRFGDLGRLGLGAPSLGPLSQIALAGRIPVIDVGTVRRIAAGDIAVRPGIERFEADSLVFVDGRREPFDAVLLATGYHPALDELVDGVERVTDGRGLPTACGTESALPGLWFVGFASPSTGALRTASIEARRTAAEIAGKRA